MLTLGMFAQSANDAITFGQFYSGGTARYMSMGGAFNALGGDFSTLSVNPAGLGVYRSGEFTATVDLRFNKSTTNTDGAMYNGNALSETKCGSIDDTKSNFNFNNIGYVQGFDISDKGLIRLNFGIGYNRLKNYHKAYHAKVLGSVHSLTYNWENSLNDGVKSATTGAYVANLAYLINSLDNAGESDFESPLLIGATVDYVKDVEEKGRINEWVFSLGGNINDMIYFGATLGIQDIVLKKNYYQTEYFNDNTTDSAAYKRYNSSSEYKTYSTDGYNDNFCYYSEEKTDGTGVNGKFGVIVRPGKTVRIGLAVHTPTVQYLKVKQYADITNNTIYYDNKYNLADPIGEGDKPGEGFEDLSSYKYRSISPYKLHGSVAFVVAKCLAIDAEADVVDYSTMRIKDSGGRSYEFRAVNDAIKNMYKTSINTRIGAEYRVVPEFSLRAGFAFYESPYENNIYTVAGENQDAADYIGDRIDYSGGFGYRVGDFFMDFAYIHSVQENRTMVFDDAISPYEYSEMNLDHKINRFMMTLGFKF